MPTIVNERICANPSCILSTSAANAYSKTVPFGRSLFIPRDNLSYFMTKFEATVMLFEFLAKSINN